MGVETLSPSIVCLPERDEVEKCVGWCLVSVQCIISTLHALLANVSSLCLSRSNSELLFLRKPTLSKMIIKLSTLAAAILSTLAIAQDQCNLLPVAVQELPLYSLVLHTLNKTNQTLCERYTPANSTQLEWITILVNLAFTGDYVPLPDLWPANPNGTYQSTGILDPMAVYRDPCYTVTKVNLVPYFNGTYKSNNRNGVSPIPPPSQNPRNIQKKMEKSENSRSYLSGPNRN